jgi:hypothetical protein
MKKDLEYYKQNAEENYITTPISVLRYITELENECKMLKRHKNKWRSFADKLLSKSENI